MARDCRFRAFTLAQVELVEARDSGTIAVIGLSGSGDAVAMVVQAEAIDDFLLRLRAVRPQPLASSTGSPAVPTIEWEEPAGIAQAHHDGNRP